jgi:hypothetical protein
MRDIVFIFVVIAFFAISAAYVAPVPASSGVRNDAGLGHLRLRRWTASRLRVCAGERRQRRRSCRGGADHRVLAGSAVVPGEAVK